MMAPDLWKRVKELFATAAPLEPDARASFLRDVCGDDSELQRQVERLLVQHDAGGGLLGGESESEWILSRPSESPAFSNDEVLGDRFRIVGYIGRGGMGEVYEADDLELGGRIALKALRAELLADERNISRFKQEIQLARRVTHPHVCRIFDVGRHRRAGEEREHSFLTMELLAGETLASFLKAHGRLSCEQAWPLIVQMAEGLDALHRASIIHRDFKPGNVMLTRDGEGHLRAVITDFGLAHHVTREVGVTATVAGQIIGTLDYMAPEQLLGKSSGPATDIFAFGVVSYEMLTAQKPFAGRDRWEAPASTHELAPELPPNWDRAIRSCLQTSAAARPASMAAVVAGFGMPATGGRLDQLGSAAALDPGSSAAEKTGRRFSLRRRHFLWLAAGSGAAVLAVANLDRQGGGEPSFHTSSVEAAEAFERALEETRLGRLQAAADQLRETVRRDPSFALAHIVLAKVQMTLGRYSQGHESAQRAYELTTRNPERYTIWDHYRVLGRYKHLRREFSAARDDFRALAGFALERAEGLWFGREEYHAVAVEAFRERALIYSYEGFPREAREEIRKARRYDPRNPGLDVLESLFLVEQGNGSGALELAQQASRRAPKQGGQPYVYPAWAEGMAWLLLDNPIRARESFVQLSNAQGDPVLSAWGHLFEAQALVYAGEWQRAMEKLLETDTPDRSEMISEVWTKRQLWTAGLASLMGLDWRGPLRRLEDLAGGDPSPQNGVVFRDAALLAVRHQDIAAVQRFRRLLEAVERGFPALSSSSARPEVIPFVHHYAEHVRGEEARLLGQAGRSLRIFSDQAYLFLRDPQSWMSLAQVQASMGDWDRAIESYHQVLALKGRALTACACTVLPLAHLELARCFRQVSRSAQARQSYDAFLRNAGETELAAKVVAERNTLPL